MESPPPYVPKPTALAVFGILNILFGVIGLAGALMSIPLYFTPLETQTGIMPDLLRSDAFCASCLRALFFPGVVLVVLQIFSGIGLLRSNELARKIALGCAAYGVAAGIFVAWLNITYMLPFSVEYVLNQVKEPGVAEMTRTLTKVSGYFGIALGMLYPVLGLIFLSRAKVRQYCKSRSC